ADMGYNMLNAPDVTVTNTDDDSAGITVNAAANLTTTEAGGTATFTIRLNTQPSANVVIGLSSTNPAEGKPSPTSLTFTSVNWNPRQTVTSPGQDHAVQHGSQQSRPARPAATSADMNYNGIDPPDVTLTNTDNDSAGITVNAGANLTTTEAAGTATFTVVL